MQNLEIKLQITKLDLTAEQWDLFTNSMDCTEAANALNETFKAAFNSGRDAMEIRTIMEIIQSNYSNYGAYDTEPTQVIEALIRKVFPEEE